MRSEHVIRNTFYLNATTIIISIGKDWQKVLVVLVVREEVAVIKSYSPASSAVAVGFIVRKGVISHLFWLVELKVIQGLRLIILTISCVPQWKPPQRRHSAIITLPPFLHHK